MNYKPVKIKKNITPHKVKYCLQVLIRMYNSCWLPKQYKKNIL